jgi:hypothetical protein
LPQQLARVHSTASIYFHHHILLSFQVLVGQENFGLTSLCDISFTISSSDGCIGRTKGKQRSSPSLFTLVSAPLGSSSFAGRSSLQRYSGAESEYMGFYDYSWCGTFSSRQLCALCRCGRHVLVQVRFGAPAAAAAEVTSVYL